MSRSKSGADQAFGRLRFKCPEGHQVGEAIMQSPHVLLNQGAGWVRIETGALDPTLRFRCDPCESLGRVRDLQASGRKVADRLRQIELDPTRGTEDYVLGG